MLKARPGPDPQPQRQSPADLPAPQPPSPHPPRAMPTRSEAGGESTRRGQARRPQRRAGLPGPGLARSRSLQPGAASPAAATASSRRKPEDGGAAQRRPGKEAVSPDPAGSSESPRAPGGACAPTAPGADPQRLRRAPPESREAPPRQRLRPPRVRGGRCGAVKVQRAAGGVPGGGRGRSGPAPTFLAGWTQPHALPGRPGRGKSPREGPGKAAGGFGRGRRIRVPQTRTLLPPGLFGKLQGRREGGWGFLLPAGLAGGRSKHFCLARRGLVCFPEAGQAVFVPSRKRRACPEKTRTLGSALQGQMC